MLSQPRISEDLCCHKAKMTGSSSIIHYQKDRHMLPFSLPFTITWTVNVFSTLSGLFAYFALRHM